MELEQIIDLNSYQISNRKFKEESRRKFDQEGVLLMPNFLKKEAIEAIYKEGIENKDKAYYCNEWHNVYQKPTDPDYPDDHIRNRKVASSKGCITDDQIPENSALRTLYNSQEFKDFLCYVLSEEILFPYADELSSINLHYANTDQELGWHFDQSSFSITLMIEPAEKGGEFQYVRNVRDADKDEMNFEGADKVLSGKTLANKLNANAGALAMFRGRNAMHCVTPNEGENTRILAVLAYNAKPGISLSENARRTFYGRL